jgi:hypothetical protein
MTCSLNDYLSRRRNLAVTNVISTAKLYRSHAGWYQRNQEWKVRPGEVAVKIH